MKFSLDGLTRRFTHTNEVREVKKIKDLTAKLDSIPATDEDALLDWLSAYDKTDGPMQEYAGSKDRVLRSFEQKGYRPFVEEGSPDPDHPRTIIEQTLFEIKERNVVPQFFDVMYRKHRGK